jgi:hypothetical protein
MSDVKLDEPVVRNCCECDDEFVVSPRFPRQIRCGPCQVTSDFG